jgi:anti-sigma-K factor RskA
VREDLHTLAGAYALDALPDQDRLLFEGHLARCDACAEEVRGLRETTAQLGAAAAASAPAHLRVQTLARVREVRQVPPVVPDLAPRARRARRGSRLALGLAAACLAVAVGTGTVAVRAQHELDRAEAANRAVAAVLSATDARTVTGGLGEAGAATVVLSRSRGQIVFASSGLRRLPESETYELWLMGPREVRPAGLLRPDPGGRTPPLVAGALGDADRVGLTVEPAGGSPQPTTTPLVVLTLPVA